MPVLAEDSPPPVAEVREVEPDLAATILGPKLVVVFTAQPEHYTPLHFDLRTVNIAVREYQTRIDAARGPFPISTVVVIDETMAPDSDPMEFNYPLISKGRVTVIARKGELPPFEWEF